MHFFMMETLGSGVLSSAFFTMCVVWLIHQAEVWLRTWEAKEACDGDGGAGFLAGKGGGPPHTE